MSSHGQLWPTMDHSPWPTVAKHGRPWRAIAWGFPLLPGAKGQILMFFILKQFFRFGPFRSREGLGWTGFDKMVQNHCLTARGDRSRSVSCNICPCGTKFHGQKHNFALDGDNRFMGPSWLRAHGLIFEKVYIVWVNAPSCRRLSCRKSHIRGNGT